MAEQPVTSIDPMTPDDVAAAHQVSFAAFRSWWPAEELADPARVEVQRVRGEARIAHILATDPGGSWVARQADGKVVGAALAICREDLWGLSMLAVDPDCQARGIGTRLLEAALSYEAGSSARLILSSNDPRAIRAYHRAGLSALPSLQGSGALNRTRIPTGLRSIEGDPGAHADVIDRASRHVRGASHLKDVEAALRTGCQLLVCEDRGFALARDGSPYLVAACDEEAASDLLWSCLATAGPGEDVYVMFITAGNDWALTVAADAGLSLSPDGPVFASGVGGPMKPYLPSGAYL